MPKLLLSDISGFVSTFEERGEVVLPEFSGTRIMMMPVVLRDITSIPESLNHYKDVIAKLFEMQPHSAEVGYLTIDEKIINPGASHRRAGIHVDGVYYKEKAHVEGAPSEPVVEGGLWGGGRWGGGKAQAAKLENGIISDFGPGMLTVANPAGCRAWKKVALGFPRGEGECDHLSDQFPESESVMFKANTVYWANPLCVHESVAVDRPTKRQFVRLSLPSDGPWFKGYTENPLGVQAPGLVLPRRAFMDL